MAFAQGCRRVHILQPEAARCHKVCALNDEPYHPADRRRQGTLRFLSLTAALPAAYQAAYV